MARLEDSQNGFWGITTKGFRSQRLELKAALDTPPYETTPLSDSYLVYDPEKRLYISISEFRCDFDGSELMRLGYPAVKPKGRYRSIVLTVIGPDQSIEQDLTMTIKKIELVENPDASDNIKDKLRGILNVEFNRYLEKPMGPSPSLS